MTLIEIDGGNVVPKNPKVPKTDRVTWHIKGPVGWKQFLAVNLYSDYGNLTAIGRRGSHTVTLPLAFMDGTDQNVNIPYSVQLVTVSAGGKRIKTEVLYDGPSLVIDNIGKPPMNPFCPDDGDEREEEECVAHSGSYRERD